MPMRLLALVSIIFLGVLLGAGLYAMQLKHSQATIHKPIICDTVDEDSLDAGDAKVLGGLRTALPATGSESVAFGHPAESVSVDVTNRQAFSAPQAVSGTPQTDLAGQDTVAPPVISTDKATTVVAGQAQAGVASPVPPLQQPVQTVVQTVPSQLAIGSTPTSVMPVQPLPPIAHAPVQAPVSASGTYRVPVSSGDGVRIMTVVNR